MISKQKLGFQFSYYFFKNKILNLVERHMFDESRDDSPGFAFAQVDLLHVQRVRVRVLLALTKLNINFI